MYGVVGSVFIGNANNYQVFYKLRIEVLSCCGVTNKFYYPVPSRWGTDSDHPCLYFKSRRNDSECIQMRKLCLRTLYVCPSFENYIVYAFIIII